MPSSKRVVRPEGEERWRAEALRLYRRYQMEIVESLGLCPWAHRARELGQVRESVLTQASDSALKPSLSVLRELSASEVDVVLLLYPRMKVDRSDFDRFASRLRQAYVGLWPVGQAPFVCAVFHPEAQVDLADPERLIPFLRRTPDPTLQFIRASALERVRAAAGQGTEFVDVSRLRLDAPPAVPLREQIARTNHATALRLGLDTLTHKLDDIVRDRARTYRRLESSE
jgi:hypothetical protein